MFLPRCQIKEWNARMSHDFSFHYGGVNQDSLSKVIQVKMGVKSKAENSKGSSDGH